MSSLCFKHRLFPIVCGRLLRLANGCNWLDSDMEKHIGSTTDSSKRTTSEVRSRCQNWSIFLGIGLYERIIVLRTKHLCSSEPRSNFKAFCCGQRHYCVCHLGLS